MEDLILKEFLDLYEAAPKISQMKNPPPRNEEYLAFKEKKGLPAAFVSSTHFLEKLPHYESLYPFFKENKIFWLIPSDLEDGSVIGFLLRGFAQKDYRVYTQKGNPQMCCGWQNFQGYKGEPILLTEGLKDQLFLAKYYKYSLALLTDSVSAEMYEILSTITKKIVLALDNDEAGEKQRKRLKTMFHKNGVQTQELVPRLKDWGQYFTNSSMTPLFRVELTGVLTRMGYSESIAQ